MFGRKVLTVGFGLAFLSSVSCSRPLCDVNKDDPRCDEAMGDMAGNSSISISPLRLHYKTGGAVAITGISPGAMVSLVQQSVSQSFGMAPSSITNMLWSAPISALQGFSPGLATLNITQAGKTFSKDVRLFAISSFAESNEIIYKLTPPSTITWLGIGGQSVFTLNTHTDANMLRAVFAYKYSAFNDALNIMSPAFSSGLPTYAKAAATAGTLIELRSNTDGKGGHVFESCPYGMSGCADTTQISTSLNTSYQDIDIAADPLGAFLAYVTIPTAMTEPVLSAMKIESMHPTDQMLMVQGSKLNNDMTIKSIAVGDIDGDGKTDLIVWHSNPINSVEIFIQQSDGGFKYSDTQSKNLQTTIGTSPMLALASGDLDADGLADVMITRAGKIVLKISNTGDGFVADQAPVALSGSTFSTIDGIAVGDVGGPQLENTIVANDIVIASKAQTGLAVLINTLM